MNKRELKEIIRKIIYAKKDMLTSLKSANSDNPQVKELIHRASAEQSAFLAVYDALNNNSDLLKTYLPLNLK